MLAKSSINYKSLMLSIKDECARISNAECCIPQSKTGSPLCSFENNSEYVYDVQWSPTHPAVFASVDGEGRMDFWNMNTDTEVGERTSRVRMGD